MVTHSHSLSTISFFVLLVLKLVVATGQDMELHTFERTQLTDVYFSEGASAGDINNDGQIDIVYGPYWFAGPTYEERHEIYTAVPQPVDGYADNFFCWIQDFTGDGLNDVFVVGFPGTPAFVYVNPGPEVNATLWTKHQVFDWVSNESPQLVNLVGDARPELVCTRDGFFGFVTIDWTHPLQPWTFHPISEKVTDGRFGHGLGVGDVNNDGKLDLLHSAGWYEQPASSELDGRWMSHAVPFTDSYGGAEMHAYDVDGDGDNDVITSLAAHDFGLAWFENVAEGGEPQFKQHLIMGSHPSQNRYGVVFSELHSVAMADMDGDGLKDIVTGKTYWSHHRQSPMWDAGAVVYWFKLVRNAGGVDFIPYLIDTDSGIGRQVTIADVDQDQLPDVIVGGMKGAHLLRHKKTIVDKATFNAAQPKLYEGPPPAKTIEGSNKRGRRAPIDLATGRVAGALEAESIAFEVTGGVASPQNMLGFPMDKWSNASQVWWSGGKPGDRMSLTLPEKSDCERMEIVFTRAPDYGIIQVWMDDKPLGNPIDLYADQVITSGQFSFPISGWTPGVHKLTMELLGANPKAVKSFMVGLDYIRLVGKGEKFAAPENGIKPIDAGGRVLNLDFEEGSLADWAVDGDAFQNQPIAGDTVAARRDDMASDHEGEYWIGGFEKSGDTTTGTLTSSPFLVKHRFASFLIGGGSSNGTRVEIVQQGKEKPFFQASGRDRENLHQVVVDLQGVMGQKIQVRLVDEVSTGWGHLNFDHFRFHDKKPAELTPSAIALVADDYPHQGLSADAAAAAMKVPDGFTVTVSASEPDVKQPIAMCLDDRGRVWIAEAYEYPIRAPEGKGRDRILIFEDTDGDGKFDNRKVFAESLNLVSGLEVGHGGVWVGAAPYLMFIADRNFDDVPDAAPEILLDGWGLQDTHETLNAFNWGPDGWLYGCHGVFTHSLVGKPGTKDADRVPINAGVWRYHPVRHEFQVFAHGTSNPWGVDFNDHGQAFITACVIPHLFHMIQHGRYERQGGQHFNPYTYQDIVTIADHLHYLGANPHGGNGKSDEAGGGHAHSGAMIYLADRWPANYRNAIFMNNIHGQRLNVDLLNAKGSGYVGSHAPDFLLTGDQASQILNLRTGPDGQAYMIDWYDMQACHLTDVGKHDRRNGRIYKIQYGDTKYEPTDLRSLTDLQLAEHSLNRNDFFVRRARLILAERATTRPLDLVATKRLTEIATSHEDDTRRLRGLWALHAAGGVDQAILLQAMVNDPSPYVRGWGVQLALDSQHPDATTTSYVTQFVSMAKQDASPVVRLYLASAAQQLSLENRWMLVEALASHAEDASDHNLPLMIWYASEPLADEDPRRALAFALTAGEKIPLIRELMLRRIGSGDLKSSLDLLVDGLAKAEGESLELVYLKAIKAAVGGQRRVEAPLDWQATYQALAADGSEAVKLVAISLGVTFGDANALAEVRKLISSASTPVATRKDAVATLLQANDPMLPPVLQTLLASDEMRLDAIRGLAQFEDSKTAPAILAVFKSLNAEEKASAMATLCARATYAQQMLQALGDGKLASTDLTADLVRQLTYLENPEIDRLIGAVWGQVRQSAADKAALIASYTKLIQSETSVLPDTSLGRSVFAKTCQRCHVLYGVGQKLGPDLTGSNRSNLEYLLSNIVDPSAVMASEYQQSIVLTDNGQVITGIVRGEDSKTLTVQSADAIVIVPKDEIENRKASDKSMMPDDQLKQFTEHEVRSLIAYLSAKEQVPLLATPENTSQLFNAKDLEGWSGSDEIWYVENGEIVGKTNGLARNEWLVSDMLVDNFRFSVDIKLIDNIGNSGIQFRSTAEANGEVSGYQADAGPGWWGKLYEEHGRALLWDKSGEDAVRPGQWNRYEIEAIGSKIRTRINGVACVELDDPEGEKRGIIALQLHSGGPTEVRFKDFKLDVIEK